MRTRGVIHRGNGTVAANPHDSDMQRCHSSATWCCSPHLSEQLSGLIADRGYTLWDLATASDVAPERLDLYLVGRAEWSLDDFLSLRRSRVLDAL